MHFVLCTCILFQKQILFLKEDVISYSGVNFSCIFWLLTMSMWYLKQHEHTYIWYYYFCVWPKQHRDSLLKAKWSLSWRLFLLVQCNEKLAAPSLPTKLVIFFCFLFHYLFLRYEGNIISVVQTGTRTPKMPFIKKRNYLAVCLHQPFLLAEQTIVLKNLLR